MVDKKVDVGRVSYKRNTEQSYLPGLEAASDDYIIRKHNAIIHRSHVGTQTEEKLFSAMLMAARAHMKTGVVPEKGQFQTTVKFLRNFAKITSTQNQTLKDALNNLQKNVWQYDLLMEDKEIEWRSFSPISEVRIDNCGLVTFYFAPTIMEALANPSIYTLIDLKIIRGLKSVYSIALYELGLTHIGETIEFTCDEIRTYMGCMDGKYSSATDLRRYVAEPAVEEVNEKTDIKVQMQLLKKGSRGSITGFAFTFIQIEEIEILPESHQLELIAEFCALLPDGIGSLRGVVPLLKRMLESHNEEYVRSNIQYFVERVNDKNQAPIPSPGGYLRRVLENDYGKEIRERQVVERMIEEKKQAMALAKESFDFDSSSADEKKRQAEDAEIAEIQDKYYSYFQRLSPEDQANIINEIEKSGAYFGPIKTQIMGFLQIVKEVRL